jgi:TFIIF-interacting CTD phosphatase-like protein
VEWVLGDGGVCRHFEKEQVVIYPPAVLGKWIGDNLDMFGEEFNADVDCYKILRGWKSVPKMLEQKQQDCSRKTLVLDLDETLVHSSFNPSPDAQILIPIDVDSYTWTIFVQIRPGAKYFLEEVCKLFEVVIYTASISKYADPLMDKLDPHNQWSFRLFREHCTVCSGIYIKDLLFLGRSK